MAFYENRQSSLQAVGTADGERTPIKPIQFMALADSEEVKIVLQEHARWRREVLDRYSRGDFLEITLEKLISSNCAESAQKS